MEDGLWQNPTIANDEWIGNDKISGSINLDELNEKGLDNPMSFNLSKVM